jgi:hypothetical protein
MSRRTSVAWFSYFNYLLKRQSRRDPLPRSLRRVRLLVEELETRALLSAGGSLDGLTAHPDLTAVPQSTAGGGGYTPAQIQQAYGVSQTQPVNGVAINGAGETIAIVESYDDPNIQGDANVFSQAYGLPVFNQPGGPSLSVVTASGMPVSALGTDMTWAQETALDVEWAHAIAPGANILLVEASSTNLNDLLYAVKYAAAQPGVVTVSMSWGSAEFGGETAQDSTFTTPAGHPGVTFVASTGDNGTGGGPQWPAASPNVLAVGGSTLYLIGNSYGSESAWSSSNGGTSTIEPEPSYQQSVQQSGHRTTPDVTYNADPNTGYSVYNTFGSPGGQSGWWSAAGTSAGAPQWAAIITLADQARGLQGHGPLANAQALIYSLPASDFHDVTSGSNGFAAGPGYDLASGRGSPFADRIIADLINATDPTASSTTTSSNSTSTTSSAPAPNNPFAWLWNLLMQLLAFFEKFSFGASTPAATNTSALPFTTSAEPTVNPNSVTASPASPASSVQSTTLMALGNLLGSTSAVGLSPTAVAEGWSGPGAWWHFGTSTAEGGTGDPGASLFNDLGMTGEMALSLNLQGLGGHDLIPVNTPPEIV